MSETPDTIAREVLDVIPMMMRVIRIEMRSQRSPDLTVPHFRALLFISRNPGSSLLAVAEYLGLTSPTVCKMIDGLVHNSLVKREASSADRRKIILTLTTQGWAILEKARNGTLARLAGILSPLAPQESEVVFQAMKLLHPLFLQRYDQERTIPGGDKKI
jgi:DNA-binding MarR family transcriptional regulator